jgi:hypothetical protein
MSGWIVVDSLTGIPSVMMTCLSIVNRSCRHGILRVPACKNPDNSNLAWNVEVMQWVLLYLSIGHDRCYWEHLAQHG